MDIVKLIEYCQKHASTGSPSHSAYQRLIYFLAIKCDSDTLQEMLPKEKRGSVSLTDIFRRYNASICMGNKDLAKKWFESHSDLWGKNGTKLVRAYCKREGLTL